MENTNNIRPEVKTFIEYFSQQNLTIGYDNVENVEYIYAVDSGGYPRIQYPYSGIKEMRHIVFIELEKYGVALRINQQEYLNFVVPIQEKIDRKQQEKDEMAERVNLKKLENYYKIP